MGLMRVYSVGVAVQVVTLLSNDSGGSTPPTRTYDYNNTTSRERPEENRNKN